MGINFYARIIPSQERKNKVKKLIDENNFDVKDEINDLFQEIHIGKGNAGWKFLWNSNLDKPNIYKKLTKKCISDFLHRQDVKIYNEYGEGPINPDEFMNMALNWCTDGYDEKSYNEEYGYDESYWWRLTPLKVKLFNEKGYKVDSYDSEFYNDGLRFSTAFEFS